MTNLSSTKLAAYLEKFVLTEEKKSLALFPPEETVTKIDHLTINSIDIPIYINEFWTSKQRQASSIHEISYRACFKPQLPRFFIELMTREGDIVYDPFSGRGTTVIEAGLMNRRVISNDINPLSRILAYPRFFPPKIDDLKSRLSNITIGHNVKADIDLSMFYHPSTESEIVSIRNYLDKRKKEATEDYFDWWVRMVAINRLTGHSTGFFSVYTLPPNQAVSQESQAQINEKRNQKPPYRDTKKIILRKSVSLLRNLSLIQIQNLYRAGSTGKFFNRDARQTFEIQDDSVQLIVTSPPFLDVVQYSNDNWLRCWFNKIDDKEIASKITMCKKIEDWSAVMLAAFHEFHRILRPGGWLCFEVGEIRDGKVKLDEIIAPIGVEAGLKCEGILINLQKFTKTSNIWGVKNNDKGTNTNRIAIFRKK